MKRKPLHPGASAKIKATGAHHTPPAAITNPIVSTHTNAPDSTEARRARQWEMVQRIADLGLVIAFAGFVASGVTHCMDAARASKAAHAGSASNGIITTGTGLPCLVLENAVQLEVQPLPKSGLFSCPDSKVNCSQPTASQYGYGQGAAYREDAGVTSCTFSTPCPPLALENATGGFFNVQLGT